MVVHGQKREQARARARHASAARPRLGGRRRDLNTLNGNQHKHAHTRAHVERKPKQGKRVCEQKHQRLEGGKITAGACVLGVCKGVTECVCVCVRGIHPLWVWVGANGATRRLAMGGRGVCAGLLKPENNG